MTGLSVTWGSKRSKTRSSWSNKCWWILMPTPLLRRPHYLLTTCLFTLKSDCIISVGNCLNTKKVDSPEQQKSWHPDSSLGSLYSSQSEADWLYGPGYNTQSKRGLTCTHLCHLTKPQIYLRTDSSGRAPHQLKMHYGVDQHLQKERDSKSRSASMKENKSEAGTENQNSQHCQNGFVSSHKVTLTT